MGAPRQGLGLAPALCRDELPVGGGQTGDWGPLRAATTAAPGGTSFLGATSEPAVLQLCPAPPGRRQLPGRPPKRVSRACAPCPSGAGDSVAPPPASLRPVPPGMAPSQHPRAGGVLVPGRRRRGGKVPRGETARTSLRVPVPLSYPGAASVLQTASAHPWVPAPGPREVSPQRLPQATVRTGPVRGSPAVAPVPPRSPTAPALAPLAARGSAAGAVCRAWRYLQLSCSL